MPFFNRNGKIKLTFYAEPTIAASLIPYIEQLIEDSPDGYCRRAIIEQWQYAKRPIIALHKGTGSSCRIDGPYCGKDNHPLGSLILSPGIAAYLNPIETLEIRSRLKNAIEEAILEYIHDYDLQNLKPVSDEVDREIEDPIAIGLIEAFEAEQKINQANRHNVHVLKKRDSAHD